MITLDIRNVNEVERFIIELPKHIKKELTHSNMNFMMDVMRGAKRRAPIDTGSLKAGIRMVPIKMSKNVKNFKLVSESPYSLFQEEGFRPHSFFAGGAFNSSKLSPGTSYFVSKYTPFMQPALDEQLKTFDKKLNIAMQKALGR